MTQEEIKFLDEARHAAANRLVECEREIARTEDLGGRTGDDDEVARRRRKLLTRSDRYRLLVVRLDREAREACRVRLQGIAASDLARLATMARRLHRRARRLEEAIERTREQYRGVRMRHLALDREGRELGERLGRPWPDDSAPRELRANLGEFRSDGEV